MATTSQSHTGDGSTTNYTLQFEYVKQSDVKATLDGTATTAFTFANATTLSFNTAPASGVAIKITRETDLNNISATFFPGSAIKAEDLNSNFEQTLFVSQESNNLATAASSDVSTALTNSSTALSTANTASTNATNALNAVNNVVAYTVVANVSSLPASPSDGDRVEVTDSTNAESTSSITGLPSNFVGASGLNLRLQYSSSSAKFVFVDYIVQDPDSRYGLSNQDLNTTDSVTFAGITGPLTGNVTGNVSGSSGSCTGNAATATTLATARNINGTSFNGSTDIVLGNIPQNSQTSAYTLVLADAGKHVNITTGGVTIPSSVFSVGDAVSIYNNSASDQTITQGSSVTLREAGTANTGNRTLAQRGICTVLCVASNEFVITGVGVS